ncbi:unnamed protein product [Effrenium voratum]|nr:unnamed protein product [Effrenium voratum]
MESSGALKMGILIPSNEAGRLIGKAGAGLKQVREMSQCNVKLSQEPDSQGNRRCDIGGPTVEHIASAVHASRTWRPTFVGGTFSFWGVALLRLPPCEPCSGPGPKGLLLLHAHIQMRRYMHIRIHRHTHTHHIYVCHMHLEFHSCEKLEAFSIYRCICSAYAHAVAFANLKSCPTTCTFEHMATHGPLWLTSLIVCGLRSVHGIKDR